MPTIEKSKYLRLKQKVDFDIDIFELKNKSYDEIMLFVDEHKDEFDFGSEEEFRIYIANLLFPDTSEFVRMYLDCNKKVNEVAKITGIPDEFVIARVYEINTYGFNENGIDMDNDDKVEKETTIAIARIQKLLRDNETKTKEIDMMYEDVTNLNNYNDELALENKKLIEENQSLNQRIALLEATIRNQNLELSTMYKYKEGYEKIVGSLNKTQEKDDFHR